MYMDVEGTTFEPLMDAATAAGTLSLHPKTLMKMARENRIPAFRVGRYWLFRASLLDQWLNGKLQCSAANSCA
jgi:excisionase family DNA binding protein